MAKNQEELDQEIKIYNKEIQAQLKKHKNIIEKLQNENEQLRNELISQANQLSRVKTSAAQRNILNASEEIKKVCILIFI